MNPLNSPEMAIVWMILFVLVVSVLLCVWLIWYLQHIVPNDKWIKAEHEDVNRVERED